ncbi:MAG: metallophosphoesterase family protein, partial [Syntrophothermus sp.]
AASFWLFSGDITSEPVDSQIGELFTAAGFIFRTIPIAMVPGNHDMGYKIENGKIVINKKGKKERLKSVSPLWNANFTLPQNGIKGLEGTSYTFDYQGVRFLMLNSNSLLQEQAAWMEKLLADNPNRWTVAVFHHPLYSSGRERDDRETRNAFLKVFDEYSVDIVLTGHDHTYSRSVKLKNNSPVTDSENGTVYITSVSGPKQYTVNSEYKDLMVRTTGEAQLFQEITINGSTLNFKAYTADGKLFDSFDLKK